MTSSRDEQIAREDLSELTVQVKFGSQRKRCVNLHLLKILLFYGIGVDTRKLKGKRETKGHLQKDCCKRERQGGVEELKFGQGGSTDRGVGWTM